MHVPNCCFADQTYCIVNFLVVVAFLAFHWSLEMCRDRENWRRKRTGAAKRGDSHGSHISELTQRAAEGRSRQTLRDKRDSNSVWKQFPPNFTFLLKDLMVKDPKTIILIEYHNKHAGNRPVTFVTHKCFAALFFVPSCCVIFFAWNY